MRIESVRIENFRSFRDQEVAFNNYSCLVGPNGAGKSNVLTALNVFFRHTENLPIENNKLEQEDFHCKDTEKPIRITVTFCELSIQAKEDFSHYVRQDKLVVTAIAVYDADTKKAEVKQYGSRLGMLAFKPFFEAEAENQKVADLKKIYADLRETYTALPTANTKDKMRDAIIQFEATQPDLCKPIPSEDRFYGFTSGANLLAKHIQWIYVPAVKDASSEQVEARNTSFGKLISRTVRSKTNFHAPLESLRIESRQKYQILLESEQYVLNELSNKLQSRIGQWAHPDARLRLEWKQAPDKSVKVEEPSAHVLVSEGEFESDLSRFGHGFQRSYLLALLQELAESSDTGDSTLILAVEEPELYQHPPQARHLATVLNQLAQKNTQVIVSTHEPLFVSGDGFADLRLFRKGVGKPHTTVSSLTEEELSKAIASATGEHTTRPRGALAKVHQVLQSGTSEMFFTHRLVLVEGLEDIAFIMSYLELLENADAFRKLGGHLEATNGKRQMVRLLAIARAMKIPTYVVFDADSGQVRQSPKRVENHRRDNRALLAILNASQSCPFPSNTIQEAGFTMWHSEIGSVVEADIGKRDWQNFRESADEVLGHAGKLHKNVLHIGESLSLAFREGKRSRSLEQVCAAILDAGS